MDAKEKKRMEARIARGHFGYCKWCGKPNNQSYGSKHGKPLYCSRECMGKHKSSLTPEGDRVCINCGKEFRTNPAYIKRRKRAGLYCSVNCYREFKRKNPKYNIDDGGYRYSVQGREHRVKMESHLGAKLDRSQHVHHKNGNRLDNNISNLEVVSASDHQRIHRSKITMKDKSVLEKLYANNSLILKDIANIMNVSVPTISVWRRKFNIPKRK